MNTVKRIKVGDVFEINTPKGKAYLQYVYNNPDITELIRVLHGKYYEQPNDLSSIIEGNELYLVHFPLKVAYKRGIVKLIGRFNVPNEFQIPKNMRSLHVDVDGNRIWYIVDYDTWRREPVKELSNEQIKLSPWGTWNDTLLIERISEGWTLDKWI